MLDIFRSLFMCSEWFSFTKGLGQIDHKFPVASREDVSAFSHMFSTSSKHHLTDSHLWISVMFRPERSHFTRSQRLSCCMAALFMSMITSAMFYGTEAAVEQPQLVSLGSFRISLYEMWVSVLSIIIVVPVNFLIVTIFRQIRPTANQVEFLSDVRKNAIMCLPPKYVRKQTRRRENKKIPKDSRIASGLTQKSAFIDDELDKELKELFGSRILDELSDDEIVETYYKREQETKTQLKVIENDCLLTDIEDGLNEINDMLKTDSNLLPNMDKLLKKNEVSMLTYNSTTTITAGLLVSKHVPGPYIKTNTTDPCFVSQTNNSDDNKNNDNNMKTIYNCTCCCSGHQAGDGGEEFVNSSKASTFAAINRIPSTTIHLSHNKTGNKTSTGLPRSCLAAGWILAIMAIITSSFFLILYSMDWGKEKSNAWLVSFVMSLLETLFVIDPIKVYFRYSTFKSLCIIPTVFTENTGYFSKHVCIKCVLIKLHYTISMFI